MSKPHTADQLVSETEAADFLGVSKWTVRRLRHAGALSWVAVGGQVRIARSELQRYVTAQTRNA